MILLFQIFDEFFFKNNQNAAILKMNQDTKKFPGQIYTQLPKVPFMSFSSWTNVMEFYFPLFTDLKDLSPMPQN